MSYPVFYVPAGDVLPILFDSFDGGTGASITMSGLAVTDIEIYKDGSVTQRASDAGYTLLDTDGIDFDSLTGIHGFSIDTGDNTDASFYTVGAWFHVVVSAITIDAQTVSFVAAAFRIMAAEGVAGVPDVNATHFADQAITAAAGVTLHSSVASPTNITAGTITTATNVTTVNGLAAGVITAAAIADGAIDAATFAAGAITATVIADGAIDAATFAANAITDAVVAADVTIASVTGAVGSVTGAVGSVTGNVGGSVASVTAGVTLADDAITAAKIAANAIGASELAADVITDIWQGTALTEAYAADGAAATPAQLLYAIHQLLSEFAIAGTTITTKKLDKVTTAMTHTLDDATTPTSRTRAT
jgi:CBS domain-containing protein